MNTHTSKVTPQPGTTHTPQKHVDSTPPFVDNRTLTVMQKKLQQLVDNSTVVMQHKSYQQMADNRQGVVQRMILKKPEEYIAEKKPRTWDENILALKAYIQEENGAGAFTNSFRGDILDSIKVLYKTDDPKAKEAHEQMQLLWNKIGVLLIYENPSRADEGKEFNFSEPRRRFEKALELTNQLIALHHKIERYYMGNSRWEELKSEKEEEREASSVKKEKGKEKTDQPATSGKGTSPVDLYEQLKQDAGAIQQKLHWLKTMVEKQFADIEDVRKISNLGVPQKLEKLNKRQAELTSIERNIQEGQGYLHQTKKELLSIHQSAKAPFLMDRTKLLSCEKALLLYSSAITNLIDTSDFAAIKADIREDFKNNAIGQGLKKLFYPSSGGNEAAIRKGQYKNLIVNIAEDNRVLDPENLLTPDDLEKAGNDIPFFTSRMQELRFLRDNQATCIQIGKMHWKDLVAALIDHKLIQQAEAVQGNTLGVAKKYSVQLNQVIYGADGILWYPDRVVVVQHKSISTLGNPLEEKKHHQSSLLVDAPFKDELRKAANQLSGHTAAGGFTAQGGLPEIPAPGKNSRHLINILLTRIAFDESMIQQYVKAAAEIMREKTANGNGLPAWKAVHAITIVFADNTNLNLTVSEGGKVQVQATL